MSLATPLASVADALIPAAILLALKYPLLLLAYARLRHGRPGSVPRSAARWFGRIAAVLAILPALRMLVPTGDADALDPRPLAIGVAILCLGAAALLADDLIVARLRRRFAPARRRPGP